MQWNSTAPQIKEKSFKVLADDKGIHPAQNIAPIGSTGGPQRLRPRPGDRTSTR